MWIRTCVSAVISCAVVFLAGPGQLVHAQTSLEDILAPPEDTDNRQAPAEAGMQYNEEALARQWEKIKERFPQFALAHLQLEATVIDLRQIHQHGSLTAGEHFRSRICSLYESGALVTVPRRAHRSSYCRETPCVDTCTLAYAECFEAQPSGSPDPDAAEACVERARKRYRTCLRDCAAFE